MIIPEYSIELLNKNKKVVKKIEYLEIDEKRNLSKIIPKKYNLKFKIKKNKKFKKKFKKRPRKIEINTPKYY